MAVRPPKANVALLSLVANRKVRDMIGAWPNVIRPEGWRQDKALRAAVYEDWSALSGVPGFMLEPLARRLIGNGYVDEDGGIDSLVASLVQGRSIDDMPAAMRKEIERQREAASKPKEGG